MPRSHNRMRIIVSSADEREMVAMVLVIKAIVFIFGGLAYHIVNNQPLHSVGEFFGIWNRWDGPHYLDIAEHGYQATGENRILLVFYPLYPWTIRLFAMVFRNAYLSALIVSTIASLAAALTLYRLVALDYSRRMAREAVWFLFIFPTSYFLHIDYTESLFLALVLAAFLAARHDHWPLAGVIGMLAGLTHVNGAILFPALAAEAISRLRDTRRFEVRWLWTGLIPVGLLVYLLINYRVTGDATAFLKLEADHWVHVAVSPLAGIADSINVARTYEPYEAQIIGVQVLIYLAIGLIATIVSAAMMPLSYTVWMVANWLLFASQSWDLSTPRYLLAMFPIFILIARLARSRRWNAAITTWSFLWLAIFASQFVVGHWTF